MRQKIYVALCVALSFFILSCSNKVSNTVTKFHDYPLPNGETIRIEPLDPAKKGSLEFKQYASMIAGRLRTIGYNPVGSDAEAELIAEIDYKIDLGKTNLTRRPDPYVSYHFYDGNYYVPYYYGSYDSWEPTFYSETEYNRILTLNIVKAAGSKGPDRKTIFEGWVLSTGKESNLKGIMPYMITAMFTNFPGESGASKVITINK